MFKELEEEVLDIIFYLKWSSHGDKERRKSRASTLRRFASCLLYCFWDFCFSFGMKNLPVSFRLYDIISIQRWSGSEPSKWGTFQLICGWSGIQSWDIMQILMSELRFFCFLPEIFVFSLLMYSFLSQMAYHHQQRHLGSLHPISGSR